MSFKKCIKKGVASLVLGAMLVSSVGNVNAYAWSSRGLDSETKRTHNQAIVDSDITLPKLGKHYSHEQKTIMMYAGFAIDRHNEFKAGSCPELHGKKDYVSAYIYLMNVAVLCKTNTLDVAINRASCGDVGTQNTLKGKLNKLNANGNALLKELMIGSKKYDGSTYRKVFNNDIGSDWSYSEIKNPTKEQVACFIAGMAFHTATDAYAHSAYGSLGSPGQVGAGKNAKDNDNASIYPNRFTTTLKVAKSILNEFKNGKASANVFYQPNVHKKMSTSVKKDDYKEESCGFALINFERNMKRNTNDQTILKWVRDRDASVPRDVLITYESGNFAEVDW